MKLYGVRASALTESRLSWQFEQVNPDTINMSPKLRVPFLIDGDLTLTDSAVNLRCVREQASEVFCRR